MPYWELSVNGEDAVSVVDAGSFKSYVRSAGVPAPPTLAKANSYFFPRGIEAGRGWLLLTKKDLDSLDKDAANWQLKIGSADVNGNANGATSEVTIKGLHLVYAEPIGGIAVARDETVYLVEIADRRDYGRLTFELLDKSSSVEGYGQVNFRTIAQDKDSDDVSPADHWDSDHYITSSLNSGNLWTWATLITSTWLLLPACIRNGTSVTAPSSLPTQYPERFSLVEGLSLWESFGKILALVGHTIYPELDDTAWTLKRLEVGADDGTAFLDDAAVKSRLIDIAESYCSTLPFVPEFVKVCFPNRWCGDTSENQIAPIDKNMGDPFFIHTKPTNAFSNFTGEYHQTGTAVTLFSQQEAVYYSQTTPANDAPDNSSNLQTLAGNLTQNFCDMLEASYQPDIRLYHGVINCTPGSRISAVVWRDLGIPEVGGARMGTTGVVTEVRLIPNAIDWLVFNATMPPPIYGPRSGPSSLYNESMEIYHRLRSTSFLPQVSPWWGWQPLVAFVQETDWSGQKCEASHQQHGESFYVHDPHDIFSTSASSGGIAFWNPDMHRWECIYIAG